MTFTCKQKRGCSCRSERWPDSSRFARKYDTSCQTCHVFSFPKLNDFGNRFRDRGDQMGTDDDLESAFMRFNNFFSTSLVNVNVGKFELDLPFSENRSPRLNTPFVLYHYMSGKPFNVGPSAGLG